MSKEEHARNKRVRTKIPLVWKAAFKSIIYNISSGGLYFKCNHPPNVNETLELNFTLPDTTQSISCSGIVRWVSDNSLSGETATLYGVGLEFDVLEANVKEVLDSFVDKGLAEQRLSRRLPVRIVVDYLFAGENFRTLANDISRTGMFLVSTDPLQLDDIVHMRFRLPDTKALIKARGLVRWRHDAIPQTLSTIITPGMGVEFTDTNEVDLQLIDRFIASHSK